MAVVFYFYTLLQTEMLSMMFERFEKESNKEGPTEVRIETDNQQPQKDPDSILPWIEVAKDAPYFVTDEGKDWHPIGQNDAITWVDLSGLFRRRNMESVESYLRLLSENGSLACA
jgi:hypothetical protein